MVATLFAILVTIVIAGWLWFYIARPILVDYGVIRDEESVSDYVEVTSVVMSRSGSESTLSEPSVSKTAPVQTPDQTESSAERRKKMLDICTTLRRRGFSRDEARALLNLCGLPLDNNVWAQVPLEQPEPEYTTPIAGRPTSAQFETDPDLAYQPPPR